MTTITKERIELFIKNPLENGLTRGEQMELARIALASLEREQIRHEHAKWSDSTFGCVGPIGPLKHLSKEALEAAAEPDDLSEWADMQFLLWDAQRRAGISDAEITVAMSPHTRGYEAADVQKFSSPIHMLPRAAATRKGSRCRVRYGSCRWRSPAHQDRPSAASGAPV